MEKETLAILKFKEKGYNAFYMPIEGTLEINAIKKLLEQCNKHKTILAVDEVYYPFGGPTAIDLIARYENLFIMRSLSKAFGFL